MRFLKPMDDLFEEFWRVSLEKFAAEFGSIEEATGAEIGKPFMRAAWNEVVVPHLKR